MGRFVEQRVVPFYLALMRTNAVHAEADLLDQVARSGRQVTLDEVTRLLGPPQWREQVMGAWYAVVLDSRALRDPLTAALTGSAGDLTAPPLAVAATVTLGADALPALRAYAARSAQDPYLGANDIVAACIEYLGGQPDVPPDDLARGTLAGLRHAARRLQQPPTIRHGG